jgi:hypothetical protein
MKGKLFPHIPHALASRHLPDPRKTSQKLFASPQREGIS